MLLPVKLLADKLGVKAGGNRTRDVDSLEQPVMNDMLLPLSALVSDIKVPVVKLRLP